MNQTIRQDLPAGNPKFKTYVAIDWVDSDDPRLTHGDRAVLLAYNARASWRDGSTWVSANRVALDTGYSRRTVFRTLAKFERWKLEEQIAGKQIVPVMVHRQRRYHTSNLTTIETRSLMTLVNRHEWHGNVGSDLNLKSGSPEPNIASLSREPDIRVAIAPHFADDTSPPQQIISEQTRELEKPGLAPMLASASAKTRPAKKSSTPSSSVVIPRPSQADRMRALAKLREQHGFKLAHEVIYKSVAVGPELQVDRGAVLVPELRDEPRSAIPEPPMFRKDAAVAMACIASILRGAA